jgi:hypothetical protein
MEAAALQTMDHLQQTFREWVRKGMKEPAPSFDALSDSSMYLPADVIAMLREERGLRSFWTYGQAVRQLAGRSAPDGPEPGRFTTRT